LNCPDLQPIAKNCFVICNALAQLQVGWGCLLKTDSRNQYWTYTQENAEMRKTILTAAFAAALLTGCSKGEKPVVMTPEMEAEQKQAVESANQDEAAHRKNGGQASKPLSGAEKEAQRANQKK
jgi:hypothetical protein